MSQIDTRKRLFAETYRRRPWTGAPRPRLIGGQAEAEAQRLSQPTIRPIVFGVTQFLFDMLVLGATGYLAATMVADTGLAAFEQAGIVWLGALMNALAIRLSGGYGFKRMRSLWQGVALALGALLVAVLALYAFLTVLGIAPDLARPWLSWWAMLAAGPLAATRVGMRFRIVHLARTGRLEHRIVLIGGGEALEPLIREIDKDRHNGRRMCGFFDDRSAPRSSAVVAGHHKMGDVDDLVEFTRLARIDTVIVALPRASQQRMQQLLARLFVLPVDIRVIEGSDIPDHSSKRRSRIGPFRLIEIYKRPLDGRKAVEKRAFDLVFASLAIVLLAPLMLLIAALIKLDSPGPVLFRQRRHGFNNKPIEVLKFRSMYTDQCDPTAVRQVRRGDARVTRIGRFIRRSSIDELPQFFNVLRGELSLVGPRPHATSARTGDILYDQVTDAYSARHKVKPGVTGWAQINGLRGEMNTPGKIRARVEHDLYYIENWSLWLDFKIMLLTPISLVTTKNAY